MFQAFFLIGNQSLTQITGFCKPKQTKPNLDKPFLQRISVWSTKKRKGVVLNG